MSPGAAGISPWLDALPEPPSAPALDGTLDVEVAVIGAGYTGLCTALALRAEGVPVCVLERESAGFGASGRNAGHLTATIGKDLATLVRVYGRSRARALVALAESAIAHVEQTIARHRIDCGYQRVGNVVAAVDPSQHGRVERTARLAEELGAKGAFLPPEEMRRRGLPAAFSAGHLEGAGGVLDPGRYVRGLRAAAQAQGAQLFERTPVLGIEEGPRVTLRTPGGRVRARQVVLATNAYTPELGRLRHRVLRAYVSLFETAPLSAAQRAAIDWRGGEGIYTAHEMLESYRLTERGTIVGGAKQLRYGFGGRALPDADPPTFARLEATFRERFPELAGLTLARCWSGPIAFTLDFLPALGVGGKHRNVFHAVGYAGHGLALASHCGALLAGLLRGREEPARALRAGFHPPLPPEPLRWLLVRALSAGFGALDRRVDRAARRRRAGAAP